MLPVDFCLITCQLQRRPTTMRSAGPAGNWPRSIPPLQTSCVRLNAGVARAHCIGPRSRVRMKVRRAVPAAAPISHTLYWGQRSTSNAATMPALTTRSKAIPYCSRCRAPLINRSPLEERFDTRLRRQEASPAEHYIDTRQNLLEPLRCQFPHTRAEKATINGKELRRRWRPNPSVVRSTWLGSTCYPAPLPMRGCW